MVELHACLVCGAPATVRFPVIGDFKINFVEFCATCALAHAVCADEPFLPPAFGPNCSPADAQNDQSSAGEIIQIREKIAHVAALMRRAIRVENYEEAARRRDELVRLEKQIASTTASETKQISF